MRVILVIVIFFLPSLSTAGGPPNTVGHVDIELLGTRQRVTLGLPYTVAQRAAEFTEANASQAFANHLFQKTLGEKPLLSGNVPCLWEQPLAIISFAAIKIQAVATCPQAPRILTLELPFLHKTTADFFISVQLHPDMHTDRIDMSKESSKISIQLEETNEPEQTKNHS